MLARQRSSEHTTRSGAGGSNHFDIGMDLGLSWRGVSDRPRRSGRECPAPVMGGLIGDGLRPKWEPYKFCSSHRCLQLGDVGQGRVRCFRTDASRFSPVSFLSLPATSFAPIMVSLVFSDYLYIVDCPQANPKWTQRLCFRCWNFLLSNPAVKSIRCNVQHPRNLNRRVSLRHKYSGTHT